MSEHNVYVDWPCEHDEHQGGERRWTPRTWGSWVPHIEGCGWNIWENQVECLTRVASLSVVLWISCRVPIIVNLLQLNTNQLAHQSGWSCKTPPTRQSSCRPIPTSTRSSSRPGAWLGWKILPSRSPSTLGWECWSGGDCGTHCHDSKPSNAMYFCIYFSLKLHLQVHKQRGLWHPLVNQLLAKWQWIGRLRCQHWVWAREHWPWVAGMCKSLWRVSSSAIFLGCGDNYPSSSWSRNAQCGRMRWWLYNGHSSKCSSVAGGTSNRPDFSIMFIVQMFFSAAYTDWRKQQEWQPRVQRRRQSWWLLPRYTWLQLHQKLQWDQGDVGYIFDGDHNDQVISQVLDCVEVDGGSPVKHSTNTTFFAEKYEVV